MRNVPERYKNLEQQAKKSRSAATRLFCLECVGYHTKEVRLCTAPACPLYPWRLGSLRATAKHDAEHG